MLLESWYVGGELVCCWRVGMFLKSWYVVGGELVCCW
jgi:hypothetical protein